MAPWIDSMCLAYRPGCILASVLWVDGFLGELSRERRYPLYTLLCTQTNNYNPSRHRWLIPWPPARQRHPTRRSDLHASRQKSVAAGMPSTVIRRLSVVVAFFIDVGDPLRGAGGVCAPQEALATSPPLDGPNRQVTLCQPSMDGAIWSREEPP